jgi:hypothetical protein
MCGKPISNEMNPISHEIDSITHVTGFITNVAGFTFHSHILISWVRKCPLYVYNLLIDKAMYDLGKMLIGANVRVSDSLARVFGALFRGKTTEFFGAV